MKGHQGGQDDELWLQFSRTSLPVHVVSPYLFERLTT